MRRISVSYPFILLVTGLIALDTEGFLWRVFISILAHEIGHLLAIIACGGRVEMVHFKLLGLKIDYYNPYSPSYFKDILIAFSGPFINLLLAFCCLLAAKLVVFGQNFYEFLGINVVIMCFNLLPIMPLDGGVIAKSALCAALGRRRGGLGADIIGGLFAAGLVACGFWIILKSGGKSFMPLLAGAGLLAGFITKYKAKGPVKTGF